MLKRLLSSLLFAVVLGFGVQAQAVGDWGIQDTVLEATYLGFHTIDWGQTRYIAQHPLERSESNVILGKHPSTDKVDLYFASTALLHVGAAYVIPNKPIIKAVPFITYRTLFQTLTIGMEAAVTQNNARVGIGWSF